MSAVAVTANAGAAAGPFTSIDDARGLIERLASIMDALASVLKEESAVVRAGRLREAQTLAGQKAELAGAYLAGAARLKANAGFVSAKLPELATALARRHEAFQAALGHSLAVLATVHAVAEGVIRGAAEEASRRTSPQVYGAGGRAVAPASYGAQPVAISRTS